jgi:hypothetical protein
VRWLVAIVAITVLNGSAAARKKIVIMEPALAMACPSAPSWPQVLDCLKKHNLSATIVGTLDGAKLISVQDATVKSSEIEAFALYTQTGKAWILGGLLQQGGVVADLDILRFERVTSAGKNGYRFDLAMTQPSAISMDGVTSVPSVYRTLMATFCGGTSYHCMTITPQCSSIVFGQTVQMFAGSLVIHDGTISVKGFGTVPSCSAAGEYSLGF